LPRGGHVPFAIPPEAKKAVMAAAKKAGRSRKKRRADKAKEPAMANQAGTVTVGDVAGGDAADHLAVQELEGFLREFGLGLNDVVMAMEDAYTGSVSPSLSLIAVDFPSVGPIEEEETTAELTPPSLTLAAVNPPPDPVSPGDMAASTSDADDLASVGHELSSFAFVDGHARAHFPFGLPPDVVARMVSVNPGLSAEEILKLIMLKRPDGTVREWEGLHVMLETAISGERILGHRVREALTRIDYENPESMAIEFSAVVGMVNGACQRPRFAMTTQSTAPAHININLLTE